MSLSNRIIDKTDEWDDRMMEVAKKETLLEAREKLDIYLDNVADSLRDRSSKANVTNSHVSVSLRLLKRQADYTSELIGNVCGSMNETRRILTQLENDLQKGWDK